MFVAGILELLIIVGVVGAGVAGVILVVVMATRRSTASVAAGNPNLRPCPDCGQYISIRAVTCPQCGAPMKGR